jgi:hypothetical protein
VGSLLLLSYKLRPLLLILPSLLIASLLCQISSSPLPLFLMLSHALSCVDIATSICSDILVDNKRSFGESLVYIGSLLGVSIAYL